MFYATVATNIFPSPWKGEGEGGGAAFDLGTNGECAPPSQPSPFKGEGEKVRRLQAAHGLLRTLEALTE